MNDQTFPDLDGIDTAAGLENTADNAEIYRRMLIRFRDSSGDFETLFREAQQDADPNAALRKAHTLRGLAATLGLKGVIAVAQELEIACENAAPEKDIDQLLDNVVRALSSTIAVLESLE